MVVFTPSTAGRELTPQKLKSPSDILPGLLGYYQINN